MNDPTGDQRRGGQVRRLIESRTAEKHGWGSDPYRWVSHLTPAERDAVQAGSTVWFRIEANHYLQSGYKIVVLSRWGRWDSREPTAEERKAIDSLQGGD